MLKKIINSCLLASIGLLFSFYAGNFKAQQLKSSRVKVAYQKNRVNLQALLKSTGVSATGFDLYLQSFKQEKTLGIWVKNSSDHKFGLLKPFRYVLLPFGRT